jgi:hypothetical protein
MRLNSYIALSTNSVRVNKLRIYKGGGRFETYASFEALFTGTAPSTSGLTTLDGTS